MTEKKLVTMTEDESEEYLDVALDSICRLGVATTPSVAGKSLTLMCIRDIAVSACKLRDAYRIASAERAVSCDDMAVTE